MSLSCLKTGIETEARKLEKMHRARKGPRKRVWVLFYAVSPAKLNQIRMHTVLFAF